MRTGYHPRPCRNGRPMPSNTLVLHLGVPIVPAPGGWVVAPNRWRMPFATLALAKHYVERHMAAVPLAKQK